MLTVDFADPVTNADPFPLFGRLQAEDPVHWSPSMKAWIVTRYDDVKAITIDNAGMSANRLEPFFAAASDGRRSTYQNLMTYLGHWMVFKDPPDHTRLRRLFTRAFTSRAIDQLKPSIAAVVDLFLDELDAKGRAGETPDWIADFAYALPATVIMDLLGVPRDDLRRVKIWSDDIALFIGTARASPGKYERAESGAREMAAYFRSIVAERTAEPRDDMISQMVAARDAGDGMTTDEVIATCILLLFAGHETTTNLLGNGLYHALRLRTPWEQLTAAPGLVGPAIEEWLRYDGPSGSVARVVTRDVEFGGRQLRQGQRVFAFTNAANRDPAQFENADAFDITRSPNPHLTFGHGIHFCLGAPLARLEAQMAIQRLVERFPRIRLATTAAPQWSDSIILRGIKSLPVHLN